MKRFLSIFFIISCSSSSIGSSVSECRFSDDSMEIFGLAAYGYAAQIEKSPQNKNNGYLYLWKKGSEAVVTEELHRDSYGSVFNPAISILKNTKNIMAYALAWEDKPMGTKYGKIKSTLRINAGYADSAGYDVYFNASDLSMEAVETGCGVNLLLLP